MIYLDNAATTPLRPQALEAMRPYFEELCGDIMRIYLEIQNGVIKDAKFKTFGCGAAIATSSMATELVKGKTVKEALAVTNKAVMEALDGLPTEKIHCSLLAEEAIHAAIEDYRERNGQG